MSMSSSSPSFPVWDVFLSFYGKDTRRNFIASLYVALDQAGILTFRDDPELTPGQDLSSGLVTTIRESKKFIVVLSKNYACSSWCLDELVEILWSCKINNNQVIPIFYYVNPSDVRHHRRSFAKPFIGHKRRYSDDTINKWRSALAQIADMSGFHLTKDATESESYIVNKVIDTILLDENPKTSWAVFLSFLGIDTQFTFTSHLKAALDGHGVSTYMGYPEQQSGEFISGALLQAIQESKIYVVVFSENYASSVWCLDVLVHIHECCESMGRLLIPVFYHTEPSVVYDQTGIFNEAFDNHKTRFDAGRLEKWRVTLKKVEDLAGYQVDKNRSEADIINDILLRISPKTLYVAKYPVGLGSRVREMAKLLRKKEGITKIGIHGMAGIGKTTLAKAVFNENFHRFQGSCFLANVREVSGKRRGLERLQQQLINDVLECKNIDVDNMYQGIAFIKARICSIKVLIVIDDLDDLMPLKFLEGPFASGSIIILTTRNEDLLDSIKVQDRFRLKELSAAESSKLFRQHAFHDNEIPDRFTKLSQEILEHAGGLPLALQVFGSNLFNQSEEYWKYFIDKWRRVSTDDVAKALLNSFDALKMVNPKLQDIFLDIACFFIGWKKEVAFKIMETCYAFISYNIDILMKRCLLTINDRDELEMHNLLRDMGRNIARNNSPGKPGKYSRLWTSEDTYNVLNNDKGTESIEGIISGNFNHQDSLEGLSLNAKTFRRMIKLRFLSLTKVKLTGSFEETFEDLRWLFWDYCPLEFLPTTFYPEELVILELPHSKLTRMWELNMDSRVFEKLKTLDMKYSLDLIETPDFTKLPCLETLNLEFCESLMEVHPSIGSLVRLISMNLCGCVNLRSLPDSICNLRALKSLNIGGCSSLKALPIELGNIESLTELIAWGLDIPKFQDSSDDKYPETPSSSSSDSTPTRWDVFLSFRGVDTRIEFTSHLYSALSRRGVRAFVDDPELHKEGLISESLLQAIHESKSYIVVLSENYASSTWCLNELVEIYNCHRKMSRLIIPVFYHIDPLVVRHQTGSFKKAFEKYHYRFAGEMEKVYKWRKILKEVANFSGYHASEHRSESDIISSIVEQIILEINPKTLEVSQDLVGLDSRLEDIKPLLWSGTEGVIIFGIYGMGGVGKTTLAKYLYNQLLGEFEGSCFLANVNEISLRVNGLESLQNQLINDILKSKNIVSVEQGTDLIRTEILSTKVLVVFDDLDHPEHFRSLVRPFASGSVVILTTRNEEVLEIAKVEPRYRYMVNELDAADSLRLFTRHAFRNAKPSNSFMVMSKDIVHYAGGLPLVLEVFGSYLCMQSEVEWKSFVQRLQRIPYRNIHQKLIISLDTIEMDDDPVLKNIFLDIACFFVGWKKENVVEVLETYYPYVDHNIDMLKARSLLTVNSSGELRVHDLLRDMAREFVRCNYRNEPGKHSRLWRSQDICSVLKNPKETQAIEGIIPHKLHNQDGLEGKAFTSKSFQAMDKLRFLYLRNVSLAGGFKQAFKELRWFLWEYCPLKCLPSGFDAENLVILELTHSKMRTLWQPNVVPHVFEKLKTLNMSFSRDLVTTPDFTTVPCLEILNLKYCESLVAVHASIGTYASIGTLARLVSIDLHGCKNLRSLPQTICNLRGLEVLIIGDCSNMRGLPMELGNIKSLKELDAENLSVSELPDSIGRLGKLVKLRISYNNLKSLPDTIYNLRSLETLDLGHCVRLLSISKLPPNLKWIKADRCTSMERLPNLSNLKMLEELDLTKCSALTNIIGLEELSSIRALHLEGCNSTLLAYFTKHLFQVQVPTGAIRGSRLRYKPDKHLVGEKNVQVTVPDDLDED